LQDMLEGIVMQPEDMKAARKSLGWTQQQLADALGMSRKAIVEMEGGKAPIEKRTALAVRYLGLPTGKRDWVDLEYAARIMGFNSLAEAEAGAEVGDERRLGSIADIIAGARGEAFERARAMVPEMVAVPRMKLGVQDAE